MSRVLQTALALVAASCGPASASQGEGSMTAASSVDLDRRGVFSMASTDEVPVFVPWTGEAPVQAEIERLRAAGGGDLRFTAGEYELEFGFDISEASGIRISGPPGAILRFAPAPTARVVLAAEAKVGDTSLQLTGAEALRVGRRYQLYPESLQGDRILEWTAAVVDGDVVTLDRPVHFMGHVKAIPAGSVVVQELNAFRVMRSTDISIEGLTLDGVGRGEVRGHTTLCGIYVVGNPPGRDIPRLSGLAIRGCTLTNFQGRGICVYRMENVLVENCSVRDVQAEGIELDHFTAGRVVGCDVDRAGIGIVLNDAFDSTVERNTVSRCRTGIAVIKHFTHPHVNRGLIVQDNILRANVSYGISVRPGVAGNVVRRNRFAGMRNERWIKGGEGNDVSENAALEKAPSSAGG